MKIEELIKQNSIKVTNARVEILTLLKNADRPLCYEDFREVISMDKATFYRNISKFSEKEMLNSFESNDKKRYFELKKSSHGHFVCLKCNKVECLYNIKFEMDGYRIDNIIINGTCKECQNS